MRLLVLAALLFRGAAAGASAFETPRVRGLHQPRGPRAEHGTRRTRRPIAPLMLASVDQQDQVRRIARRHGARRPPPLTALLPTSALQDGRTALQVAAGLGHAPVVKKLIAAGADVNKPTKVRRLRPGFRARVPPFEACSHPLPALGECRRA